ncbi:MAG: DHA2 family efflux MFS transporter permease subunit [Neisseria sp.]|uniref:DHA2 family efflux MFS transporter permease subunit n=1 Tax=Neisseria sp. TaxID=192066 RepID=UPI0026DD2AF8|nr:DHA2 family efflux MFS transporter permease subunit [Neisseria sp.]MDO4641317.1 DHA2 family efflux MFS transporter permease subunit [Neisseria sp.]
MSEPTSSSYEFFADNPNFPRKLIMFTVFIGAFFGYLNETLLNVALTTLMQEFHVERTTVQWISTGFLLVMGACTPITANVIQWFTTRNMLMITMGTFLIGSLIAAFAQSFDVLLAGRILQAVSAAFTVPLLFNTVLLIYPPNRRGTVMGIVTMMFIIAPAIGPTLSGIIVDHLGWRYLFLFTVPFTVLSILLALKYLTVNLQPLNKPKIDLVSAILSIIGFGGLVYSSSNFATLGMLKAGMIFAGSLVVLFAFVRRQRMLAVPLIDLKVLGYTQYRLAILILAGVMFVFIGMELVMPMYMQQVIMLSATATGLVLLPGSVAEAVLSPLMGRLLDKKGARRIVIPGVCLLLIAFVLMLLLFRADSPTWLLAVVFTLVPASAAMIMVTETHGLNALPKPMYPHGTAIISTVNPIAGALGAAFFVGTTQVGEQIMLMQKGAPQTALMHGVHWAFGAGLIMAALVALCAFKLKSHERGGA